MTGITFLFIILSALFVIRSWVNDREFDRQLAKGFPAPAKPRGGGDGLGFLVAIGLLLLYFVV